MQNTLKRETNASCHCTLLECYPSIVFYSAVGKKKGANERGYEGRQVTHIYIPSLSFTARLGVELVYILLANSQTTLIFNFRKYTVIYNTIVVKYVCNIQEQSRNVWLEYLKFFINMLRMNFVLYAYQFVRSHVIHSLRKR